MQDGFVIEMSAFSYALDGVTQILKMRSSGSLQFSFFFLSERGAWDVCGSEPPMLTL